MLDDHRNPASERNTSDDSIALRDVVILAKSWISFFWSKRIIILVIGVLGAGLGIAYSIFSKPKYTAVTTFVLEEGGGSGALGDYAGLASMVGINLGSSSTGLFAGDNIIELYKSRVMAEKTLLSTASFGTRKQLLINRFIEFNQLNKKWDKNPRLKGISFDDSSKFTIRHDSLMRDIIKDINEEYLEVNKPDKRTNIIKVAFVSKDELFAKAFVEQLVATVNNFYVQTRTRKSQDNVNILQQQTDSVRAVMNSAISTTATIVDATPNLNPTRQILRTPAQRSQFTAEANKVILEELIKNLELSRITLRKETPLIQVIDVPILPLEKKHVGKIKGLVFGGIFAGFLALIVLTIRRLFKQFVTNG